MFGGGVDALVEERHVVGVHGVGVHAAFHQAGQRQAEAQAVGGEAFVAFG